MAKKKNNNKLTFNIPIDIKLGDSYDNAEVLFTSDTHNGSYVWLFCYIKEEDAYKILCVEREELASLESLDELDEEFKLVFDSKEELVKLYQALGGWVGSAKNK